MGLFRRLHHRDGRCGHHAFYDKGDLAGPHIPVLAGFADHAAGRLQVSDLLTQSSVLPIQKRDFCARTPQLRRLRARFTVGVDHFNHQAHGHHAECPDKHQQQGQPCPDADNPARLAFAASLRAAGGRPVRFFTCVAFDGRVLRDGLFRKDKAIRA